MTAVIIEGFEMPKNCCFCTFERRKKCMVDMRPITEDERKPYSQRTEKCPLQKVDLKDTKEGIK